MESSSEGVAMFWESAMDVKSSPLREVSLVFGRRGVWRLGGNGSIPNQPDQTFCGGVLLCLQFIEDKILEGFGF